MLSVLAYVRVSTDKQGAHGISLDAQVKQITEFAKANHLQIKGWFRDVASARNEENGSERPEFNKAIELAVKKKLPVIVATPDRFTRTKESYDRFKARGGAVYTTDGFGEEEAVMRAKIARAQHDGDMISQLTREGQKRARAAGKKFGNPDSGPARVEANKVRRNNARLRREEFDARLERAREIGAKTDAEVARHFNDTGHVTARGGAWTAANVARMRGRIITFDKAPMSSRAGQASKPHVLFTPDDRMTEEGLGRACSALTFLGDGEKKATADRLIRHFTAAPGKKLPRAIIEKLAKLIDKAEIKMSNFYVSEGLAVDDSINLP